MAAGSAEQVEFFERKIRPVLAQECYECHAEGKKRKGGLLLDSRPGWQEGGDSGDAIVPGNAAASLLMQSIRHAHDELKMPKNGAKLDDEVLRDFEKWINEGAVDPRDKPPSPEQLTKDTDWKAVLERRKQWWAFQPVRTFPTDDVVVKQGVDGFLNAKLGEAGLKASPRAGDETVLRRLHYVLTGLPPTPKQIDDFLAACATDRTAAREKAVDALLKSPHFGEKWARHWMDWVRYAESYGSEGDPAIPYAWRYRDYLIRAFNADVPYHQMVNEAIAGDLLPQPRLNGELGINESAIGVAQLRMVLHGFSPTDSLDEMVTFTDNQIDVVSKAFQAMTVSCARCHDHKFDAVSQTDFYAWFGVFSSTHPGIMDVSVPKDGAAMRAEMASLKERIRQVVGEAWLKAAEKLPTVEVSGVEAVKPAAGDRYWDLRKERWFGQGESTAKGTQKAGTFTVAHEGTAIIAQVLPAGVYSHLDSTKDRGVLMSPRFQCDGGTLWIRCSGDGSARARYIVQNYPRTGTIHKAVDLTGEATRVPGWRKLDLDYWKGDEIFIECSTAADRPVETKLDQRSWFGITDVLITKGDAVPPTLAEGGEPVEAVKAWMENCATDAQALLLDRLLRESRLPNDSRTLASELVARYRQLEAALPQPVRVPGVLEADAADAKLFVQGDHKRPGDVVKRRFLEAIDARPFETKSSGRLELAQSLVDESNPLTDRVIVNRLWHHVFGNGLAGTVDNFGRLGEKPSHPELLDWLARTFRAEGGSVKAMLRRLVLTDAFSRADTVGTAGTKDPENRLLSHWTVRRLEAESIRDSMLTLSGQLEDRFYGEPVSGGSARRSVYVEVIRNRLDPLLTTFDAPVPSATRGKRDSTNVPAQSLALLNDPAVQKWSQGWARRVLADVSLASDEARAAHMVREATGRPARSEEVVAALAFIEATRREAAKDEAMHEQLAAQRGRVGQEIAALVGPVRARLEKEKEPAAVSVESGVKPFAEWDFEKDGKDLRGSLDLKLEGGAKIQDGALVLNGDGSVARSAPLTKKLKGKTLEAWVLLSDLNQAGGGVITVQDRRGEVFDSIVFGEKFAGQWLAGSNNHKRTESLDGPIETEAGERPVHVAIVWSPNGRITAYRDGAEYGRSYTAKETAEFAAGECEILLGCRHGSPSGNRLLKGRILRARLYDRVLKAEDIGQTRKVESTVVTERDVLNALTETDRGRVRDLQEQVERLDKQLQAMKSRLGDVKGPERAWSSLALSLFNLKEFVYLR